MQLKFPQWLQRKANPAGRVILLGLNVTGPVEHTDFAHLAKLTYRRNPTVHACVTQLASACATVPWVLYEYSRSGNKKARRVMSPATHRKAAARALDTRKFPTLRKTLEQSEIESHPLLKLLEQPNETQTQFDYVEQLLSYWLIAGNAYEKFIAPNRPNAAPLEMWNMRPDRMKILPAADATLGIVGAYRYTVNDKYDDHDPSSIVHRKFFDPTDDFYGLSPLQAASRAWQTDNLGSDWNYALLNQGARPSGALVTPTTVGDDAYERLKRELVDSYGGATNAGTPMLLEGGIKWESMSLTPMEMDFLAGLRRAATAICMIYHVPPEIIGLADSKQYNSFAEARMALYQEGAMPLLDRLRDAYNQRLVPRFGDRLFLDYDRDQIDAIQEEQAKVWDKLNRTRFLSTNEKRAAAGYETYVDPDGLADVPESILNPTPGATGMHTGTGVSGGGTLVPADDTGAPASAPTSLRAVEQLLIKAAETGDRVELQPDEIKVLSAFLSRKGQDLNAEQRRLRARFVALMSSHFRKQGAALVPFLRDEIRKLE